MVIDVSDSVISILDRLKYDLENGELVSPNNIVHLRLGEKNNSTPYDIILDKKFVVYCLLIIHSYSQIYLLRTVIFQQR